ncbi:MAG TPA: helix-turn-helix transcriptional regulator [Gryllotalpicola sp.]
MRGRDGAAEAPGAFGEQLRQARLERGITQEELANLTGMHSSNVGRIERGAANPSLSTMARLAHALGTDLGELLRGVPRSPGPS